MTVKILTSANLPITIASTSKSREAYEWLSNQQFDLLLTDGNMEHVSGEKLIEKAREASPEIKTAMMTGEPQQHQDSFTEANTPDVLLEKPFTMDQLIATVCSLLNIEPCIQAA